MLACLNLLVFFVLSAPVVETCTQTRVSGSYRTETAYCIGLFGGYNYCNCDSPGLILLRGENLYQVRPLDVCRKCEAEKVMFPHIPHPIFA
jgi:hypothetical protein